MGFRRKTRPGRLAQLDHLMLQLAGPLLARTDGEWADAPVVDLGVGARPWTTVELAEAVAPVPVLGLDIAPDVVERAHEHARPGLSFAVGSFDLPRSARLVRVMNVLRDGWADAVPEAHARIGARVLVGGAVIEGSCGPAGEVGTAHWLRKEPTGLVREGLVLWCDGTRGSAPLQFRDRLPRDLRDARDHAVMAMLHTWMHHYVALGRSPDRFAASIEAQPDRSLAWLGPGAALWSPPGGVP
ncbi:MAG: class I SAM-dependent methyltransferase [Myxococcota bacterium]